MAIDEPSCLSATAPIRASDGKGRTRVIAVANVLESVRRVRESSDNTTARIVRKLQGSPLAWLASRGRIRMDELRAAEDIVSAFLSVPGQTDETRARYTAFV